MPPTDDPVPSEEVTADMIRQVFNEGQYYERALAGEFEMRIKRNRHCEPPPCGEPVCTHSQIVYYYSQAGEPVAVVHQYRRPDGKLGASGRPDPKSLRTQGRIVWTPSSIH